ncbi:MAG: hypothetical protein CME99_11625 [Hyphomonas sp.]|uniref:hypothetical protein n=1 Tax=Hyphomonas sp. TaxID=87 RepID=UPI000C44C05C|nr:hypothetical protein [Hyphomonas sp.]MAH93809.1 hypothetical protein [Hyphomonas sp.]
MFEIDDLANPVVLGQAIGAFAIMSALSAGLAGAFKQQLPRFAHSISLVIVGAVASVLGAFGFADGGPPAWLVAGLQYGLPCAAAALVAFILGSITQKAQYLWAYVVLALFAAVGGAGSNVAQYYADDERIFDDPLMKGFAAIEDHYPLAWAELKRDLRAADLSVGKSAAPIVQTFYAKHQLEFFRMASDEAVAGVQKSVTRKLEYLANSNPTACVSLVSGKVPSELSSVLPYSIKLEEAESIENLIRSSGGSSSGVAGQEEAEALLVSAIQTLADQEPELFYAYVEDGVSEPPSDEETCRSFIAISKNLESHPVDKYARFVRSDLWLVSDNSMSEAAEVELALAALYADAAITRRELPIQIDQSTTLVNVSFNGRSYVYRYGLTGLFGSAADFRKWFERENVPNICIGEDTAPLIEFGVSFIYEYELNGAIVAIPIDQAICRKL